MPTGNAINADSAGLVKYDGSSTFSGVTVTQHDLLIGAASNGITSVAPSATSGVPVISQGASADPTFGTAVVAGGGTGATSLTGLLTGNGTSAISATAITQYNVLTAGASNVPNNVAPSATSGVPLISQGSISQPIFGTVAIAGGGTNATSFTQSNGIVTYNGTSLVNYAGPQISSGGIHTNTSQPAFSAYFTSNVTNATGDGTDYTLAAYTADKNVGANFSTSTGVFTAPVTGLYFFTGSISISNVGSNNNDLQAKLVATLHTYLGNTITLNSVINVTGGAVVSALIPMNANDTVSLHAIGQGSSKTLTILGGAALSYFCGFLVS